MDLEFVVLFLIEGFYDGATWTTLTDSAGQDTDVTVNIDSTGQMRYTSGSYSGFVQGKISYKYEVLARSL